MKNFKEIEDDVINYAVHNCDCDSWSIRYPFKLYFGPYGYKNAQKLLKYVFKNYRKFYYYITPHETYKNGKMIKLRKIKNKITILRHPGTEEPTDVLVQWEKYENEKK